MNFLQRIYKAEVIYEPNQKLEIKTSCFIRFFPVFFFSVLIGSVLLTNWSTIILGVILMFQYTNIFLLIEELSANGKENLLIINNKNLPNSFKKNKITALNSNHYIQLAIKLRKHYINIEITNGAVKLGKYRLNNTEDLKNILDGLMEFGDLEMMESFNISNSEVLQLKPKNKQLQPFSSLQITKINNVIKVLSIPNTANYLVINRNERLIKTSNKSYDIQTIEQFIIQRKRRKISVFITLKNKSKKVKVFIHQPKEVVAITDIRRLFDLLKNEMVLKNINIEILN